MRIISQDGNLDFPYNSIALSTGYRGDKEKYYIFVNFVNCEQKSQIIASYSSDSKAEKAVEMLHNSYLNYVISTNLLSQELLTQYVNSHIREEVNESIANPYFRFPKDKDLEVSDDN